MGTERAISGAALGLPLLPSQGSALRAALFFDGKNFYRGMCDACPTVEVDYDRLAAWVVSQVDSSRGEFVGAYHHAGFHEGGAADRKGFERFLTNLNLRPGFFVRREPRVRRRHVCKFCGRAHYYRTEKRVDGRLVADMIHYAAIQSYDAAVLFSGDQDLLPAVEAAERVGRQIHVATWGRRGLSVCVRH